MRDLPVTSVSMLLLLGLFILIPHSASTLFAEDKLRGAIIAALRADGDDEPVFRTAQSDLNGDQKSEIVVWVPDRRWGGSGGYPLYVFIERDEKYKLLWSSKHAWTPVVVLSSKHHGWSDFAVTFGGGGDPMRFLVFRHNGQGYSQSSTTVSKRPQGKWLFTDMRSNTTFGPIPKPVP